MRENKSRTCCWQKKHQLSYSCKSAIIVTCYVWPPASIWIVLATTRSCIFHLGSLTPHQLEALPLGSKLSYDRVTWMEWVLGFHSIWNLRNLRCLRLGLFHAPLAFPIIRGLQVNPLGSNPITAPSMTSLVKYSLLLLLTEKMERAPPYIILVKSLESVAFRRLLQDNKNITTVTQW